MGVDSLGRWWYYDSGPMGGRQRPLLKKEAPVKLVPLSFCRPAAATLRRRLGWSASSLHGRPQPAPQGVRLPPCPALGACSSWGHKGRGRPSGPRPHIHKVAGGFCSFCLPPAGGQAAPLPPGLAGGSNVCPYAPAIHKGKVVPLRGLHLAFCLASHGPHQRQSVGCRSCGGRYRRCPAPSALASQRQRLGGCTTVPALPGACGLVAFILIPPQLPPSGSPRPPRGAGAFRFSGVLRYAGGGILALFSWASGPRHRQARYTVQPQKPLLTTIGC